MSDRVYKKYKEGEQHYVSITDDEGTIERLGPYDTDSKARIAMKNRQIRNHDIDPEDVLMRNRSGNFVSLIEKQEVDEAIDSMKTPKDLTKIMKKLLKHPHSVRAMGTVLWNPYHSKYAQVLDIATRIATDIPKTSKDADKSNMQQFLLNIPKPDDTLNKMKEVFIDNVAVSGSI